MANDKLAPQVLWAERNDKLYVTINLEDCKDVNIKFDDRNCFFSAKGGADQKDYGVTLEFFKEINPKECSYALLPRHIPMVIVKKESGPYWGKLLNLPKKAHWLKTDFNKWRDEDDSDFDEAEDNQFESMMKKMGNFSTADADAGADAGGEEMDEDSDDDGKEDGGKSNLPDLES